MNKANGGDGIPVELFQILKDDAFKALHTICQWPQNWKRSVFIPIPKKSNAKECSNYCTIALLSHASKNAQNSPSEVSTVCELRTSRCLSRIQNRQRNQRSNCQHLLDHQKAREFQKKSISALLTRPKPLTMWITTNCGKFLKRWEYLMTLPAS